MRDTGTYSESLMDLLIATLCSARSTRQFRAILRERQFKRYKQSSVGVSLSRLSKKGYICKSKMGWSVTKEGKKFMSDARLFNYMNSPFSENSPHNTIIAFDIPEKNRKIRNWLRNQIKIFGYKMLQQSLWIGPGDLPSSFMKHLEDLNIRKNVKTFKITKRNN